MDRWYKKTEWKLFLTVWIVLSFYLQMFGTSCVANSQSVLTAAMVNEGRLEVDTYRKLSCDLAFYDGHYYSGQSPGISFLAAPVYLMAKPLIWAVPDSGIDMIYSRMESYGEQLGTDYEGKVKKPSNYFDGLSKRQAVEYLLIAGFILPLFTTSLFVALSAVVFYLFTARFTRTSWLRIVSTLLYAFGTLSFHISTLFFQRPIAIALSFFVFYALTLAHDKRELMKPLHLFSLGMVAGLAAWFDYFHLGVIGLLWFYSILPALHWDGMIRIQWQKIVHSLWFVLGALLPVLLLFGYYNAIFDDPLANSYTNRTNLESNHAISDLLKIGLPNIVKFNFMINFFLNNPLFLLGVLGAVIALGMKQHRMVAGSVLAYATMVLMYSTLLVLVFSEMIAAQFPRHMTPSLVFLLLFLPTAYEWLKEKSLQFIFWLVSAVSAAQAWFNVQYPEIGNIDLNVGTIELVTHFFTHGPTSSFLKLVSSAFGLHSLLVSLIGYFILGAILYIVWKKL